MTVEEVIAKFDDAIKNQANHCLEKLHGNSTIDFEDLYQEGIIFLIEEILPRWDESKGVQFHTFLTRCLRTFYSTRLHLIQSKEKTKMNHAGEFAHLARQSTSSEIRSSIAVTELLNSLSDGTREMIDLLLDPPTALVMRMRLARNRGIAISNRQFEAEIESKGFQFARARKEIKKMLPAYL